MDTVFASRAIAPDVARERGDRRYAAGLHGRGPVADVAGAFSLANSTIQPSGLPLNVDGCASGPGCARWETSTRTNTGYEEIAEAFAALFDD